MKTFVLRRIDPYGWDMIRGKVIVAETEARAREIANQHTWDEGKTWDNPHAVTCEVLDDTKEGVVLEDKNPG